MEKTFEQQFITLFNSIGYGHNRATIFQDFVEIAALSIHQSPYHGRFLKKDDDYERIEAQYMVLIGKHEKNVTDGFVKLLAITSLALLEGHQDFLGNIYMQLEISNRGSGEFFTPYHVSKMMAMMVLGDIDATIKEKGYFAMCEPACGAGGMVIAAADEVKEQGFRPGHHMWFSATDINKMCCNMTYIQASVLSLSGIVIHGNTITMEVFETWETPYAKVFTKYGCTPAEKQEIVAAAMKQAQTYNENRRGQFELF